LRALFRRNSRGWFSRILKKSFAIEMQIFSSLQD
jgi:hypothetical protein